MANAFRFKTNGVRLSQDLFSLLKSCRRVGTHGDVEFVEAKGENVFEVTSKSKGRVKMSGEVRLSNMLTKDLADEPARRAAWKAAHQVAVPKDADERMLAADTTASDLDAAHHRGVRFNRTEG